MAFPSPISTLKYLATSLPSNPAITNESYSDSSWSTLEVIEKYRIVEQVVQLQKKVSAKEVLGGWYRRLDYSLTNSGDSSSQFLSITFSLILQSSIQDKSGSFLLQYGKNWIASISTLLTSIQKSTPPFSSPSSSSLSSLPSALSLLSHIFHRTHSSDNTTTTNQFPQWSRQMLPSQSIIHLISSILNIAQNLLSNLHQSKSKSLFSTKPHSYVDNDNNGDTDTLTQILTEILSFLNPLPKLFPTILRSLSSQMQDLAIGAVFGPGIEKGQRTQGEGKGGVGIDGKAKGKSKDSDPDGEMKNKGFKLPGKNHVFSVAVNGQVDEGGPPSKKKKNNRAGDNEDEDEMDLDLDSDTGDGTSFSKINAPRYHYHPSRQLQSEALRLISSLYLFAPPSSSSSSFSSRSFNNSDDRNNEGRSKVWRKTLEGCLSCLEDVRNKLGLALGIDNRNRPSNNTTSTSSSSSSALLAFAPLPLPPLPSRSSNISFLQTRLNSLTSLLLLLLRSPSEERVELPIGAIVELGVGMVGMGVEGGHDKRDQGDGTDGGGIMLLQQKKRMKVLPDIHCEGCKILGQLARCASGIYLLPDLNLILERLEFTLGFYPLRSPLRSTLHSTYSLILSSTSPHFDPDQGTKSYARVVRGCLEDLVRIVVVSDANDDKEDGDRDNGVDVNGEKKRKKKKEKEFETDAAFGGGGSGAGFDRINLIMAERAIETLQSLLSHPISHFLPPGLLSLSIRLLISLSLEVQIPLPSSSNIKNPTTKLPETMKYNRSFRAKVLETLLTTLQSGGGEGLLGVKVGLMEKVLEVFERGVGGSDKESQSICLQALSYLTTIIHPRMPPFIPHSASIPSSSSSYNINIDSSNSNITSSSSLVRRERERVGEDLIISQTVEGGGLRKELIPEEEEDDGGEDVIIGQKNGREDSRMRDSVPAPGVPKPKQNGNQEGIAHSPPVRGHASSNLPTMQSSYSSSTTMVGAATSATSSASIGVPSPKIEPKTNTAPISASTLDRVPMSSQTVHPPTTISNNNTEPHSTKETMDQAESSSRVVGLGTEAQGKAGAGDVEMNSDEDEEPIPGIVMESSDEGE